jgi:hypothetical protein
MTRRFMILGMLVALVVGATPVMAHDDYRIIGTIAKVTETRLDVKSAKGGKTVSMRTDEATRVTRDKKEVPASELETGLSVVVDASGDSLASLVVREVRIVPALPRE